MNKHKKWCIGFLGIMLVSLFTMGFTIYSIDPYQIYNFNNPSKEFMESRSLYIQRYLAAGFAKNLDYETILVGSSMSENMTVNKMDEAFNTKSAKLSISGGTPYEIKNVLKKAISTGKVKNAIVCVDGYMYKNEIDFHRNPYPEYLYDNNPFNDLRYLLNLVIFKDAVQLYTNNKLTPEGFDINNLYLDNPNTIYSYDRVLDGYEVPIYSDIRDNTLENDFKRMLSFPEDNENYILMQKNFKANLLSIIKDNPDVNFKLYYPPNSILYWNRTVGGDQHLRLLRFKQYMYETLREYPNVEIYDFQDVKEITFNLEYYKDSSHYSKEVCDKLIERMATKTDLLTDDNYLQKIENLSNQLQNATLKEIREYSKR